MCHGRCLVAACLGHGFTDLHIDLGRRRDFVLPVNLRQPLPVRVSRFVASNVFLVGGDDCAGSSCGINLCIKLKKKKRGLV